MKDFPIDSRGEIGRKRVKVPSAMIDDIQESRLKEIIRGMVREAIKGHKSTTIPYVGKYDKDGNECDE
tara:strand:- start:152 stop:355 length:204 start_codon:yes stop_codon:yes gene_type:complete